MHYDSDVNAFRMHNRYFLSDNNVTGSNGEDAAMFIVSKKNDSILKFFDEGIAKWSIGYDGYNTTTFTQANCVLNEGNTTVSFPDGENLDTKGHTGLSVSGHAYIPANTYIGSFNDATNVLELTNAPTGSGTVTLTFNTVENKFKINSGGTLADASLFSLDTKGSVMMDITTSGDTAEDAKGLYVDFDRTVAASGTNAHNDIGIDLDVNSASLGTSTLKGIDIDVVGATSGTSTATGLEIDVDGADTNIGMLINTAGTHIKLEPNADTGDAATISVADTGDLTIATTDNAATAADLTLDIDGDIELNAAGGDFYVKKSTANILHALQGRMDVYGSTAGEYTRFAVAATTGAFSITTITDGTATDADITLDAGGDIALDSGNGVFVAKKSGTEFSAASSAYAGMILGMTVDGVNEADQSYNLTTSLAVPETNKFQIQFITPPSELVEIVFSISFSASASAQDLFLSLSNSGTYGLSSLSDAAQFENTIWNPPSRGTINQITSRWILEAANLAAIGSNNTLYVAAATDNTSGTPKLYWGGDATLEYAPLIIKAIALPLPASMSYNP